MYVLGEHDTYFMCKRRKWMHYLSANHANIHASQQVFSAGIFFLKGYWGNLNNHFFEAVNRATYISKIVSWRYSLYVDEWHELHLEWGIQTIRIISFKTMIFQVLRFWLAVSLWIPADHRLKIIGIVHHHGLSWGRVYIDPVQDHLEDNVTVVVSQAR